MRRDREREGKMKEVRRMRRDREREGKMKEVRRMRRDRERERGGEDEGGEKNEER